MTVANTVAGTDTQVLVQSSTTKQVAANVLYTQTKAFDTRETKAGAGVACSLPGTNGSNTYTSITVNTGNTYTLAAPTSIGMEKYVYCGTFTASTSTLTLTGALGTGFDVITFSALGHSVHLKCLDGSTWVVVGYYGVSFA